MPHWIVTAPDTGNSKWAVRLADCDREHAESVLEWLKPEFVDSSTLRLDELENPYDDPPARPSLMRKLADRLAAHRAASRAQRFAAEHTRPTRHKEKQMSYGSRSPEEKRGNTQGVPKHGEKVSIGQSNPTEQYKGAEQEAVSYSKSYRDTAARRSTAGCTL
jgi:hypothetical protein